MNRFSKGAVALVASALMATGVSVASASEPGSDRVVAVAEAQAPAQDQISAFDSAMNFAITAEDSESEYADPQLWGVVAKGAVKGATWVGKQVAKGGLTELGKQLIGG